MTDERLEELALASGAMQLGEGSPSGVHFIFSAEQLAAFVALVAEPPKLAPLPYT